MPVQNKTLYVIGGVALLALGIFIGASFGNKKETSPPAQKR